MRKNGSVTPPLGRLGLNSRVTDIPGSTKKAVSGRAECSLEHNHQNICITVPLCSWHTFGDHSKVWYYWAHNPTANWIFSKTLGDLVCSCFESQKFSSPLFPFLRSSCSCSAQAWRSFAECMRHVPKLNRLRKFQNWKYLFDHFFRYIHQKWFEKTTPQLCLWLSMSSITLLLVGWLRNK